jgi:hypothetical protein
MNLQAFRPLTSKLPRRMVALLTPKARAIETVLSFASLRFHTSRRCASDSFGLPVETLFGSATLVATKQPLPLALISTSDSFQLVQHFNKIKNQAIRRALVNFVRRIADRL